MAQAATKKSPKVAPVKTFAPGVRTPDTLERAALLCPAWSPMRAQSYATVAGVEAPGDGHADLVTERTHSALHALADAAGEDGARFLLGRVVAAIVADACKTGQLYSDAVSDARAITAQIASMSEGDRDAIWGLASAQERAREKAARFGLRAMTARVMAEAAATAYLNIVGEDWKPYSGAARPVATSAEAAAAAMAIFD
ncbi:hypothetical protein [Caldovatus aquaticus]|uniref:Uncharacterized protein n=1 Tax=Caldovatus aquaticus TaxID=2865671 RepID=A0ABS7F0M0_9PROT|nr:hypothetical protein [Caldovatus aquaticus]MBW8268300.1 hypothetical protein [Caldovatus aquaticus]